MATYSVWKDNVISMVRGDSLKIKLTLIKDEVQGTLGLINKDINKDRIYQLKQGDKVYFAIMGPNKPFEEAVLMKYLEYEGSIIREPIIPAETLSITENGSYDIYNFEYVDIDVKPVLQNKIITPTASAQVIEADTGYDGLGTITTNPVPTEVAMIVENGIHIAPEGVFYSEIHTAVPGEVLDDGDNLQYGDISCDMVGAGQADYMTLIN